MSRSHPLLLSALFLLIFLPACRSAAPVQGDLPSPLPTEGAKEEGSSRSSARQEWFLHQRLYPFEKIEGDPRTEAFRQMQRMEVDLAAKSVTSAEDAPRWTPLGPAPTLSRYPESWQMTSGRIRSVVISPADPSIVLLGSSSGGIWRSTDGGATFVPVSDDQADLSVASIVFSPSHPEIVYAGMGGEFLGTGVLKSTDGGASWSRIDESGLPAMGLAQRIAVHSAAPDLVLLAQRWKVGDDGDLISSGIYRSLDGGRNWEQVLDGLPTDMLIDPSNPSIVYAGFQPDFVAQEPATLFRSLDGGSQWEPVFVGPADTTRSFNMKVAASPAAPGRVYLYAWSSSFGDSIQVSDDYGETWTPREFSGIRSRALLFEAADGDPDTLYFGQYVDLYRSTDGGGTWTNLTNNRSAEGYSQPALSETHPDQFSIALIPGSGGELLLGNDGGLYRSENGGTRFLHRNHTLSLTQIYGLKPHPDVRGMLFIGTQDNGLQIRDPETGTWTEFFTGDFGRPWVDPLQTDRVCASYIFGSIYCFTDHGERFEGVIAHAYGFEEETLIPRVSFLPPFVGSGVDRTIHLGTWRLWTSDDLGKSWRTPAGELDLTHGGYDALTVITPAPSNPDVLYTGSAEGRVMRSSDEGLTWSDVTNGLPNRYVTSIAVHPYLPDRVWITFSGFFASHVFGSADGGTTWTDLQANLPNTPANALWIDPRAGGQRLLLATDIGIFRSEDGGASWAPFNEGLPPVIVTDLASAPDGRLYAATHGRGVYWIGIETPPRGRGVRR